MSYLVLARKWRPQTFSDLIGQEHVGRTLQNAIGSGRVAHAFLFTGARGVGKTSAARILAKALECDNGPSSEPCNTCPACISITEGTAVDVIEIDGASNTGVEDIRELRENIKYLPSSFRYKIFIIDEVHMLSTSAFNALLKTLEEPPAHVKFIFATTEPHKVPVTILSRCQRFDFKRISIQKIVERLRQITGWENITVSEEALTAIARKGDGSMRDSLSTLDQVLAFCGDVVRDEEVTTLLGVVDRRLLLETSRAVFAGDCMSALEVVKKADEFGCNIRYFCQEIINHFRNMVIVLLVDKPRELLDLAEGELADITVQAEGIKKEDLQRHLTILLKAESEMAQSGFPRLLLEMALVKMCTIEPVVPVREILDKLKTMENTLKPSTVRSTSAPQPIPRKTSQTPDYKDKNIVPETSFQTETQSEADGGWSEFVSFVSGRKVSLGSFLEHGVPLEFSQHSVRIGFPAGSFYLTALRDADSLSALKELLQQYLKNSPTVELVPLSGDAKGLPPSELEKKTRQANKQRSKIEHEGKSHPMVEAAIEIFSGEICEIGEIDKNSGNNR